jgi:hypothetical protein
LLPSVAGLLLVMELIAWRRLLLLLLLLLLVLPGAALMHGPHAPVFKPAALHLAWHSGTQAAICLLLHGPLAAAFVRGSAQWIEKGKWTKL